MPATRKARPRRRGTRGPANAEALRAAAHRLVLERGDDFTTQELVKEADVALRTFYRYYGGKDQLLIAVIGDLVEAHCQALAERAAGLDDPVERLHLYVTETLGSLVGNRAGVGGFMTSQHWRLHALHPEELAAANRPFAGPPGPSPTCWSPRSRRRPGSVSSRHPTARSTTPGW